MKTFIQESWVSLFAVYSKFKWQNLFAGFVLCIFRPGGRGGGDFFQWGIYLGGILYKGDFRLERYSYSGDFKLYFV